MHRCRSGLRWADAQRFAGNPLELRDLRGEPDLLNAWMGQVDRALRGDPSGTSAEHKHFVRKVDGLGNRMRNEKDRGFCLKPDPQKQVVHLKTGEFVERAERFVHEK